MDKKQRDRPTDKERDLSRQRDRYTEIFVLDADSREETVNKINTIVSVIITQ